MVQQVHLGQGICVSPVYLLEAKKASVSKGCTFLSKRIENTKFTLSRQMNDMTVDSQRSLAISCSAGTVSGDEFEFSPLSLLHFSSE